MEPGEASPGGAATLRETAQTKDLFSRPSANMEAGKVIDFKLGNGVFRKVWTATPSPAPNSGGLGPLFNARSCAQCHVNDGRGRPPALDKDGSASSSFVLHLSIPPQTRQDRRRLAAHKARIITEPAYGRQLQHQAIDGHEPEGGVRVEYEERKVELAGGEVVHLRTPRYTIKELAYGPLHPDVMLSPRIAPQMIGLGLLEAVPEHRIGANADPEDEDGDGISGRPNRVWSQESGRLELGRFGWKAGAASIRQQAASAFSSDIGLSTPLAPESAGDCTVNQPRCREAAKEAGATPEVSAEFLDFVTFYARNLAVPERRSPGDPEILKGKALFHTAGCAGCHRPGFRTGEMPGQPHLSNQLIWPYTDLLLHDMGEGLADNRPEGLASGREWRTAPLWGVGLTDQVNGHTFYLHDGRARSLREAILWHGGEAKAARDAFAGLAKEDRERLIAFVKSL